MCEICNIHITRVNRTFFFSVTAQTVHYPHFPTATYVARRLPHLPILLRAHVAVT